MERATALTWIVVAHDSARDLESFLPTLGAGLAVLRRRGWDVEVLVADNDSRDATAAVVANALPAARIIANPSNVGYGAAINRATATLTGPPHWLAFSNADLAIPAGGLDRLGELLEAAAPDVAIVGPAVTTPYGRSDPTCGRFPTLGRLIVGLVGMRAWAHHPVAGDAGREVDWVTGACQFVRQDVFTALGGFDEEYFLYYEDVDLALRASRRGHRTVMQPALSVVHVHPHHVRGRRDGRIESIVRASRRTFFRKHRPAWERRLLAALEAVECRLRGTTRRPDGAEELGVPVPERTRSW